MRATTAIICCTTLAALAPPGENDFDISWYTFDCGGGYAAGGNFELEGTIGQHDAGPVMIGDTFELTGGFWAGNVVQGRTTTVPESFTLFRGVLIGGVLEDVFDSDDSRMLFNPGLTLNPTEAPVWVIFDATLPSDNPGHLQIVMESQAGTPGLMGTLEVWNWQTSTYDEIDVSSASSGSDSVVTVNLSGNVNEYVEVATGAVRSRIGWRQAGLTLGFPWEVRLDQMVWLTQ